MGMVDGRPELVVAPPVVIADRVSVTYRVQEQGSAAPTLKAKLTGAYRRQPLRRVDAVRGVSFELREGEALGLVGANGSGKSSLLRALAGLQPLAGGRVLARSEPVLLGVGAALHPDLSAVRNVIIGCTAMGMAVAEAKALTGSILEFAEVEDFARMPLRTYSSGMRARLQFAIASATEPDVLLIDEALAVGDAAFRRKSEQRMRELVGRAGGLILVSHSRESISSLCTRALWLEQGQVKADGPTDDVLRAYDDWSRGR